MADSFRTGTAAFLGKPNAGKSTLLNAILGTKLAAVSALPQTTRDRFRGVYTDDTRQIVFIDLPGLIAPTDRLNECLRENVHEGISGVDVVLHLVDVDDPEPLTDEIAQALSRLRAQVILVVTKLDGKRARTDAGSWAGEQLPESVRARHRAIVGVSAHKRTGIDALLDAIAAIIPEGPPLYDTDALTDRDLRYLTQEMIREKAFLHLHEELPYAVAVQVDEFQERENEKWYIAATLFVERESQKGMVIGSGGSMLKKISQSARADIERICEAPVYLDLRVKVREKWRRNERDLRNFGYRG